MSKSVETLTEYNERRRKEIIEWLVSIANKGVLNEHSTKLIILCSEDEKYLGAMFDIIGNVCKANPDFSEIFVRNIESRGKNLPGIMIPEKESRN